MLTEAQTKHFIEHGFVILPDCFSRTDAQQFVNDTWGQLGYDPQDPATWQKDLVFLWPLSHQPIHSFSPKLWAASCQLVGGEERMDSPDCEMGLWVINFSRGKDQPWQPPSAQIGGWHTDGNAHRHFLDSPEQGLLVIPIFSDIEHRGGGTFIAADSLPIMARHLRDHPEGLRQDEFNYPSLVAQCKDFREITGRAGDVVLLHPHLLHNFSQNHSGRARFITNINITLQEPMCLDRADAAEYSPVERATLHALNVERLEFHPTAPREQIEAKPH